MVEASVADTEISFQAGLTPSAIRGMAEFVKKHYLEPNLQSLERGSYRETWSQDGSAVELGWGFAPPSGSTTPQPLSGRRVSLTIGPRSASMTFPGLDAADRAGVSACRRVADDVDVLVNTFLAKAKTTSLFFIFSTGEPGARDLPAAPPAGGETLRRLLSGNMTNLYLLIMAASFVLFLTVGNAAIFAVIAIQLVALFYSDRLALMVGKVRPSAERPMVTVVCVPVSLETKGEVARLSRTTIAAVSDRLKSSISPATLEGPAAPQAVQEVLATAGIKSSAEEIKVVTRDVYGLVKGVAARFRLPVPKVAIVNSVADNAAATGVSPSRSSITITAGSLEDLNDAELASVVGHELGHIRGRDSIILFCTTFLLYVGGLYLWFPLLVFLGVFYYIVIFAIIFAVGKVLETRADTECAARLGDPGDLALALTNIGFRQLYAERYSHGARFMDWLSFDPHPPIYFRVKRLVKFASGGRRIGNTLLVSLRDCFLGFLATIV